MAGASKELEKEGKVETPEIKVKEKKEEGYVFKSLVPNLYLYKLDIRFRKGEYKTQDVKEAEALREIKNIEEVTEK